MNRHWFPNQTTAIPQSVWTANQALLQESWIQNYENTGIPKMKSDNEETLTKDLQDPWSKVDAHSAFLGPSLWDESDFMVDYSALDEFLNESGVSPKRNQTNEIPQTTVANLSSPTGSTESSTGILTDSFLAKPAESTRRYTESESRSCASGAAESSNGIEDFPMFFSSSDLALASQPGQSFDPRTMTFSANELRPHPVIKKSKKKTIPDDTKDERYWERRQKNNLAAKRSRDARRLKENQIIMRASFLEKENSMLRAELEKVNCENASLTLRLKRYEKI